MSKNYHTPGKCKRKCTAARPCCLSDDVDHDLHVCRDPDCECHGAERYAEAKRKEARLLASERR